ncbi:MAG: aminotransferase class I/II-fold pyridoxal phosphate-dependent enzyme [Eggerthella lenta]
MRPYLAQHKNLILRTFSKAFSLAGARMGYILGDAEVVREFVKVRQPYSVDAVSQAVARGVVYANRAELSAASWPSSRSAPA